MDVTVLDVVWGSFQAKLSNFLQGAGQGGGAGKAAGDARYLMQIGFTLGLFSIWALLGCSNHPPEHFPKTKVAGPK